ncbi:MAG: nucleotide exchange factor GrpE [Alphaproteobacteria bacterium]|nr:nucleotide exchange factor GrpE [Alphaproteobacteria bacterium]MCB9796096.1 nucleotide exchange factor GrpE [Alphaproteobacteria bacterium]
MDPLTAIGWMLALLAGGAAVALFERGRRLDAELGEARARITQLTESSRKALEDRDATIERVKRQADQDKVFAHEPLVRALVPVLDDFDRALHASGEDEHPIAAGVRMVRGHMERALGRHGVTLVDAEGAPFDPAEHEAVDVVETDTQPPNTVLRQWSCGVRLNGRLLRAAQVVVTKAPEGRAVEEAEEVLPEDRGVPRDLSEAVTASEE